VLTGDGGLLTGLVRQVLQTGLEVEMTEHLGYERHAPEGRGSGNSRNGTTPKRVTTEIGEVDLRVPRDRAGTFEPATVPKHRRRAVPVDNCVQYRRWRLASSSEASISTASAPCIWSASTWPYVG